MGVQRERTVMPKIRNSPTVFKQIWQEKPARPSHCRSPHIVNETQQPDEPQGLVPRIVLHAPVLLDHFYSLAFQYHPSALWYFVKREGPNIVEITHRHEKPIFLETDVGDNETVL